MPKKDESGVNRDSSQGRRSLEIFQDSFGGHFTKRTVEILWNITGYQKIMMPDELYLKLLTEDFQDTWSFRFGKIQYMQGTLRR